MKPFTLRPATANDKEAIKTLIKSVQINPLGLKWPNFILAIDDNEQMIGCGQIKTHRDGSQELASIAVRKGWRQNGIAHAIINHLISQQQEAIWLTCMSRLVPFYQQFGFQEVTITKQMPPYFGRVYHLSKLFLRFQKTESYLAVMVYPQ